MRRAPLFLGILLAGCTGAPSAPSPAPAPAPASVAPAPSVDPVVPLSGQVVATVTGEPLADLLLDLSGLRTTTDANGAFSLAWDSSTRPGFGRATITGPGIVPRGLTLRTTTPRALTLDAIALSGSFDLEYYRRLVRRTLDQPDEPLSLRRWTQAPRVYLKTVDELGHPIDSETLQQTEEALADEAAAWTGGRFGFEEIVRGTGSQEGQDGWITVKWPNPGEDDVCGRAQVAVNGGWIELNYYNDRCSCPGTRVTPGTVRHEVGHAMGFFHTDDPGDLLSTRRSRAIYCSGRPSARERYHAAIAYSRPVGNIDPDVDPGTMLQSQSTAPIIIVD